MKKSLTSMCVLSLFAATSAIAASSVRIGGGAMRAGSLKSTPISQQSVSTTDTSRMALTKSNSLTKKLSDIVNVKETQSSKPLSTNSDIKELESRMTSRMDDLETAISDINSELDDIVEEIQQLSAPSGSGTVYVLCPEGCYAVAVDGEYGGISGAGIKCFNKETGEACGEAKIIIKDDTVAEH